MTKVKHTLTLELQRGSSGAVYFSPLDSLTNPLILKYANIRVFPLLFLLCRVMQRKQSLGKPDQKDLNENLAATQGLAHMIAECKKLFQVRRWGDFAVC